jgi:drug/metabolite transporter (DMT)-like permease
MTLGFVAVAIFAGSLPATRLAVMSLDANFVTATRAAIAGLIALPALVAARRPPPWRDLPKLGLCALCLVALVLASRRARVDAAQTAAEQA